MGAIIGLMYLIVVFLAFVPCFWFGLFLVYKLTGGKQGFRAWYQAMNR